MCFACSGPALLSPLEPVEACRLNGTIIGVSCCLLLQSWWGRGVGCGGKGGPLSHSHVEMKETQETCPQYTFIASRARPSLEPSLEGLPTPGPGSPAGIHLRVLLQGLPSATERCSDIIVNIPVQPHFHCPGSLSGMTAPTLTVATLEVGRQGREWPLETARGSG